MYGMGGGGDNEESVRFLNIPVITDDNELQTIIDSGTINPGLEMSKILDTWYRFAHYDMNAAKYMDYTNCDDTGDGQNIKENQSFNQYLTSGWQYDSNNNIIKCVVDNSPFGGLLCPTSLNNYYIRVMYSNAIGDDDHFCIIIGYMKDNQGVEHTLTYIRAAGQNDNTRGKDTYYETGGTQIDSRVWCALVYDFLNPTQTILVDNSKLTGYSPINSGKKPKAMLSIERNGDTVVIKTSQFKAGDDMTINTPFEPMSGCDIVFSKPTSKPANWDQTMYNNIITMMDNYSFGFGVRSNNSNFTIIEQKGIFNSNDTIYDINSGKYYRYNYSNKQFEEAGIIDTSMIPNNCFLYSTINGNREFYYYKQGSYIEIDNI